MARVLLVHGACHGAWCWRDVIPALERMGHDVRAIDLPSHGADPTPVNAVTLQAYADAVLAACPAPTVVVGHSMAGYPITLAAEQAPERVARLIYLCAYVPAPGRSLAERRREAPRQPLLPALVMAQDGKSFTVDPAQTERVFYHDCPAGTVAYANARLCAQAVAPTDTAVETTARAASVPRSYIRCRDDQTIPPEFQVTMTADWPADDVFEMACGHSPFFADPDGLATLIDRIAEG